MSKKLSKTNSEILVSEPKKPFEKAEADTAIKIALGLLGPVGAILNEVIFEHHSRIKQDRVNNFILSFTEYLKEHSLESVKIDEVHKEDFGDVFEMIIRKVSQTKSKDKIERFKKILTNEIASPSNPNFKETYIDIVGKLENIQIEILVVHEDIYQETLKLTRKLTNSRIKNRNKNKNSLDEDLKKWEKKLSKLDKFRTPKYFNLNDHEFEFYIQDLQYKSLLNYEDMNIMDSKGTGTIKKMKITQFGIGFLEFIEND